MCSLPDATTLRRFATSSVSRRFPLPGSTAVLGPVHEVRLDRLDVSVLPAEFFHRCRPRVLGEGHQENVAPEVLDAPDPESSIEIGDRLDFSRRGEGDEIFARYSRLLGPGARGRNLWMRGRVAAPVPCGRACHRHGTCDEAPHPAIHFSACRTVAFRPAKDQWTKKGRTPFQIECYRSRSAWWATFCTVVILFRVYNPNP